jgi:hypothetical protein
VRLRQLPDVSGTSLIRFVRDVVPPDATVSIGGLPITMDCPSMTISKGVDCLPLTRIPHTLYPPLRARPRLCSSVGCLECTRVSRGNGNPMSTHSGSAGAPYRPRDFCFVDACNRPCMSIPHRIAISWLYQTTARTLRVNSNRSDVDKPFEGTCVRHG